MRSLLISITILLSAPAHAWDGPVNWWDAADGQDPGGSGLFGTGSARDHGITCGNCHIDNDKQQGQINFTFDFTPALGSVGTKKAYTPGQTYNVDVNLVGEYLGITGCAQYQSHTNNFAATFEAGGKTVGALANDSTPLMTSASCVTSWPNPAPNGTTGLYGDCRVIFGAGPAGETIPGLTTWHFQWTAPAAGTGMVTMFWGGVDGNCDMMSMGDAVKSGTLDLAEAVAVRERRRPFPIGYALLAIVPFVVVVFSGPSPRRGSGRTR
jgi:hypothetical protein